MYTIYISIAICIFIMSAIYFLADDLDNIIAELILGVLTGSILGFILGIVIALSLNPVTKLINTDNYQIVSLQDNPNVNGNFFLGSGYINGTMKYIYYYKTDSDSYKMDMINYDDATIKYISTDEPPIIKKYKEIKQENVKKNDYCFLVSPKIEYVIYVPKGTIKENYNLDAK